MFVSVLWVAQLSSFICVWLCPFCYVSLIITAVLQGSVDIQEDVCVGWRCIIINFYHFREQTWKKNLSNCWVVSKALFVVAKIYFSRRNLCIKILNGLGGRKKLHIFPKPRNKWKKYNCPIWYCKTQTVKC